MEQHTARSRTGEAGPALPSTRQAPQPPQPGQAAARPPQPPAPTPQAEPSTRAEPSPRTEPAGPGTHRPPAHHPTGTRPADPRAGTRSAPGRRPRPRLTGLGVGTLIMAVTVLAAAIDAALFHGPGVFFGVVFVAVSVVGAVYVRPYDLVAAPVAAPIAFAVAIALTADSGPGGLAGHLLGVFTALALMTGWLYTGTVAAALIVAVRAVLLPWRRRRSPRCSEARRERSPR